MRHGHHLCFSYLVFSLIEVMIRRRAFTMQSSQECQSIADDALLRAIFEGWPI